MTMLKILLQVPAKEILIDDIGDDVPESEDNIDENYKA